MKIIRDIDSIAQLPEGQIRLHIQAELNGLLAEFGKPYDPSFHGWFVVLETVNDLYAPLALLPYSMISKLQDHAFDWLGKTNAHYEVLLIVNDNESVMVYLPASLLQNLPELESSLSALASPVA
jgi:hypothetical protein